MLQGPRRTAVAGRVLVAVVAAVGFACAGTATVGRAAAPRVGSVRADPTVPLAWPGGGRFLSAPEVLGSSVTGTGALDLQNGSITGKRSNFDDAPPELSLDTFSFVDHGSAGYSAVFRFRLPIVQLHEWRRVAVRHTIEVVLTAPDGTVHSVRLQPDGTTAVGALAGGALTSTGSSTSVVAGNVAVIDVPASLGVAPGWTVQGVVRVEADGRLHPNNSLNFDTGYEAGTSVVDVGELSGAGAVRPLGQQIPDAFTALTGGATGGAPDATTVADSARPIAFRFEGEGASLVAVVTFAAAPVVDATTTRTTIIELAAPGPDPLEHLVRINWSPGSGTDMPTTASMGAGDGNGNRAVPAIVSGREVRIALGAYVPVAPSPSTTLGPPGSTMDRLDGSIPVVLSRDETVSSSDGMARFTSAATSAEQAGYPAPVKPPDAATITLSGGQVTVTRTSTSSVATGYIRSDGSFLAHNGSELYAGLVDVYGNAVVYDASVPGSPTAPLTVPVDGDVQAAPLASIIPTPDLTGETTSKGHLSDPPKLTSSAVRAAPDGAWVAQTTMAVGAGANAAQSTGLADWPVTPLGAPATSGLVSPTGPFLVRLSTTSYTATSQHDTSGAWVDSSRIEARPTPAAPVATVAPTSSAPVASSLAGTNSTTVIAPSPVADASPTTSAGASPATTNAAGRPASSSSWPWVLLVLALVAAAAAAVVVARRRARRGAPPSAAQLRTVAGTWVHDVTPSGGGHDLELHSDAGTATYVATEQIGAP